MLRITHLYKKIYFRCIKSFFLTKTHFICIFSLYIPTGRKVLFTSCMVLNSISYSFFVPLYMLISHSLKFFFSFDEIENVLYEANLVATK